MFLWKLDTPKNRLNDLGAILIEQLLWYVVLALGLPYFLIHILVAVV
ncbi:MAG: hypothetical protein JSW34_10095 [Candidatus Zixiibacteriota bacterium]|nr:MAG: hypothetical protein JSW34_10095 [candidate division Zixibacteria bacterium]